MQGHGYAPTPPPGPDQGGQVTLRVIFVVVAVMSCGLLAWACLLRLASVTRRPRDWWLFALALVHIVVTLYIIGTDPGKDEFTTWRGDVGMGLLLGGLAAIVAYYLYADIRHFSHARTAPPSPFAQTTAYSGQTGYTTQPSGYNPQQSGYSYPPVQVPSPTPRPRRSRSRPCSGPAAAPAGPGPAAPRAGPYRPGARRAGRAQ
ncbi:hypothetical protein E4N62_35510 [Streptomyces sp. MNU76]|uniref:hypothetical protein n=1 Tax=Streptomyces sp. MNU76 TaxID=2560026 RepID=UPI001E306204|nr:hypothetical protein [Streptomyces sp. MNU76]MCC9710107.1 hypothetical protein [Streptomyces sp. MNU76]